MSEISTFAFDSAAVRTLEIDGEPWFVATDIAKILGYRDAPNMIRNLDEDEKGTHNVSTLGGEQGVAIINESGLYACILKSRRPEAKAFRKWVTSEVLPAIRKRGAYRVPEPGSAPPFTTSNLAHGADLAVAAERTFRSFLRAARSSGLPHARALAVANDKTRERTGLDMLRELGIEADPAAEPDPAGSAGEEEVGGRSPLAEAERITRATLRLARAAGLPHARALRQARTVAQERTGVDIFAEIGLDETELDTLPVAPAPSAALSASPQTRTEQIVARLIDWFAQPPNQARQDITVAEVLTEVLALPPGHPGWKSAAISAGAALRRLGWRMVDRGSTQKRRRVYCRAAG